MKVGNDGFPAENKEILGVISIAAPSVMKQGIEIFFWEPSHIHIQSTVGAGEGTFLSMLS